MRVNKKFSASERHADRDGERERAVASCKLRSATAFVINYKAGRNGDACASLDRDCHDDHDDDDDWDQRMGLPEMARRR